MADLLKEITLSGEKWSVIDGYDDYLVSSKGRVVSLKSGKPKLMKISYSCKTELGSVRLCKYGEAKGVLVGRLVLETFCPDENQSRLTAWHKDGNNRNDELDNLVWATRAENGHTAKVLHNMSEANSNKVICVETNKVYASLREAAEAADVGKRTMAKWLERGEYKKNGLTWKYLDKPPEQLGYKPEGREYKRGYNWKVVYYEPMEGEELKEIEGYPGYKVSNMGRVISCKGKRPIVMRTRLNKQKGRMAHLRTEGGEPKIVGIGRVIMKAFSGEDGEGMVLIYRDGDPGNIRFDNLQWKPQEEVWIGVRRRIPVMCVETGQEFKSITEASEKFGCSAGVIGYAVDKPDRTAGKMHWIRIKQGVEG